MTSGDEDLPGLGEEYNTRLFSGRVLRNIVHGARSEEMRKLERSDEYVKLSVAENRPKNRKGIHMLPFILPPVVGNKPT
jgi:hypothetical protein